MTTISATAQRTITGKVIESDTKEAVIQATVALLKTDSTLVGNAVTSESGSFKLTAPADGSYIVRITYVGFKTYMRRISMEGQPVSMGTITISPDAIMLKGATITKNLAKVTSKGDTIIYNAGAYRTPEGSVIEELVKRLPGAEVDNDGNITIHRVNCPNAKQLQERYGYRIINVKWNGMKNGVSQATLWIQGNNVQGLLGKITKVISEDMQVDMKNLTFNSDKNGFAEGKVVLQIPDVEALEQLMSRIRGIDGVLEVVRIDEN